MFLNLKNKKIAETIANQQAKVTANHPKTHREDSHERLSREQKEIKSYRQHQNAAGKKPPASTALHTIQVNNNSFTNINPHFKIKIPQYDKEGTENLSKSQEKIDSFRMEKVTNAYRKIKKIDNNDHSYLIEDLDRSQQKMRKTAGKTKTGHKKELHSNLTKTHVCATETAEDQEQKFVQQLNSNRTELLQELLHPFLELFSKSSRNSFKERSSSHRQLQIKRSLEKSSRPGVKEKKSNQILIEDQRGPTLQIMDSLGGFVSTFLDKMNKVRETIDSWGNSKKYKYVESPSIATFQQFYTDIQSFVTTISSLCLKQIESELKKCELLLTDLVESQLKTQKKNKELEEQLKTEKDKNKVIQGLALDLQQKSLYSTIFFNELSYGFDLDSHIRSKLFEEAKKNGLVNSPSESSLFQSQIMKGHHRSGIELGTSSRNLYDDNTNQFIGKEILRKNKQ